MCFKRCLLAVANPNLYVRVVTASVRYMEVGIDIRRSALQWNILVLIKNANVWFKQDGIKLPKKLNQV